MVFLVQAIYERNSTVGYEWRSGYIVRAMSHEEAEEIVEKFLLVKDPGNTAELEAELVEISTPYLAWQS